VSLLSGATAIYFVSGKILVGLSVSISTIISGLCIWIMAEPMWATHKSVDDAIDKLNC
jgi:hypothetical protein